MPKKIQMRGPIIPNNSQEVYDYYGMEAVSAKAIMDALPDDGSDVVVEVNSNGGLVTAGSDIYTALRNYAGKVTVEVTGMAASAASFAIMGADVVKISPTAQIMIHKAFLHMSGNSDELEQAANALKASDQAILNAYVQKTGLDRDTLFELMKNETYMSAERAVELGFADEVMTFDDVGAVASLSDGLLPQAVVDEYYNRKENRYAEIQAMKLDLEKEELLRGL